MGYGTGGGADKSSSAFFRASWGDLHAIVRIRIGRTFDSLHSSQHIAISSSTSHSGKGLLSALGSEQKQHLASFFTRVFLFFWSASNWAQHEHGLDHIHAFLRRLGILLCMFVEDTREIPYPFSPIPLSNTKCPNNKRRRSAGTARGVDGSMWIMTRRVTGAPTTTLIPRNRKIAPTAAARDTSCENRGSCAATARTGGCMRSDHQHLCSQKSQMYPRVSFFFRIRRFQYV